MLGPSVASSGMPGAGSRRDRPQGAGFALLSRLGLRLGLGFCSGLGLRCGDAFGLLLGGGLGLWPGCGRGLRWGVLPARLANIRL